MPNGKLGSGLTLMVGENGTGKTTVLDAVDIGLGGKYRAESRSNIGDFANFESSIQIDCFTERYRVPAGSDFMRGKYFNCLGAKVIVKGRDKKAPGKFRSGPIQATCVHAVDEDCYYDKDDIPYKPEKPVDGRDKIFSPEQVGDGITVFYFDKNRARHLTQGTYRTTFEAVCDDLNWKFRKELSLSSKLKDYRSRASDGVFDWILELAQPTTGAKLAESFSSFFEDTEFENLRLDLFDLLEPFSKASFAIRNDNSLGGVSPRKLGSGVELVLALLLQKFLSEQAKGNKIYLIDEPELHLHPRAQAKLAEILLEESRNNQILLSSHSPYLLKELSSKCSMCVFRKENGKYKASNASNAAQLFPWSPSFGEVNYLAFSMPTMEFLNELYGYFIEKKGLSGSKQLDEYLEQKGEQRAKKWVVYPSGKTWDVTIATYVRHDMHHPENPHNPAHSISELKEAIDMLKRHL